MKTDNEESKECKECNGIKKCKSACCDNEQYYNYWEKRGYEFVENRTINSKGNTEWTWIKRKKF